MKNNEKLIMMFAVLDNESKVYNGLFYSYDLEEAKEFYLNNLASMALDLVDKNMESEYTTFINRVENSSLWKLANFDELTGTFKNDPLLLVNDLKEDNIIERVKRIEAMKEKYNKKESD